MCTKVTSDDMIPTQSANNKHSIVAIKSGRPPGKFYVSVDELSDGMVALHSTVDIPRPLKCKCSFLETLCLFPDQTLWENMDMNEDREWISEGLQAGTLVLVHDRWNNEELDPNRCSSAYIVMCKATNCRLQGTVVAKGPNVSNY